MSETVEAKQITAYWSPAQRRYYRRLSSAIQAEARARIYKRYPKEPFELETGHWYDIQHNEPERWQRMFNWLVRSIKRAYKAQRQVVV